MPRSMRSGRSCRQDSLRSLQKQVFTKRTHFLRKAAERTVEATWKRIGALLDCILPTECQAYLANAGDGFYLNESCSKGGFAL
jgi:hypothetical protein